MGELKESAQQFHCHTHSRAHQYNHLQTLMTREEAKVGGHHRAKDAAGTKKEGSRRWRRRTDNKDSNKENVSVFLLFFALSGSGLVCSGPLFSLSYTHTHTHSYVHMCLLSVCLLVRKQERKEEIVEPLNDLRCTYESFLSLSPQVCKPWYLYLLLKDKSTLLFT